MTTEPAQSLQRNVLARPDDRPQIRVGTALPGRKGSGRPPSEVATSARTAIGVG
jgi:hypothetical protein